MQRRGFDEQHGQPRAGLPDTAWLNQGLRSETRATVNSLASQADALGQVTLGPALGLLGNLAGVRAALAAAGLLRLGLIPVFRRAQTAAKGMKDSD